MIAVRFFLLRLPNLCTVVVVSKVCEIPRGDLRDLEMLLYNPTPFSFIYQVLPLRLKFRLPQLDFTRSPIRRFARVGKCRLRVSTTSSRPPRDRVFPNARMYLRMVV